MTRNRADYPAIFISYQCKSVLNEYSAVIDSHPNQIIYRNRVTANHDKPVVSRNGSANR